MSNLLKLQSFVVVLGAIIAIASGYGSDSENDPYHQIQVLDKEGKYVLEWLVDWELERIYFNVTVRTKGYIGLGLSLKGKMDGADIVIGGVAPNGKPYLHDYHGVGNQVPEIDKSQDYTLHQAWEDHSSTFLSFSRPFETCDSDDLAVVDEVFAVLWAYGEKDDELEYHFHRRGVLDVYLLNPDFVPRIVHETTYKNVTVPPKINSVGDLKVWRITSNQPVPAQDTAYICTFHEPPRHNKKQHIVGFRSIIPTDLERRHIHHFLLHICYAPTGVDPRVMFGSHIGQPGQECYVLGQNRNIPGEYCKEVRHEWAVGAGPVFFPDHVGLPFLESPNEYYMLQVHLDNPDVVSNVQLQFDLEVYYTDKLRKYDGGIIYAGQATPGSPSILVPPGSNNHLIYGHCASGCTEKMFPKTGITLFGGKVHTHIAGQSARFLHYRGSEIKKRGFTKERGLLVDDNYNFNYQQIRFFREEPVIMPGDMLVKRCFYSTPTRTRATPGGFSTRHEMCNGFLWYYPYIREDIYGVCSSAIRSDVYRDFLQIHNFTWSEERRENIVTAPPQNAGLTVSDVGTNIDWTLDKRRQLQTHQRFLPQVTGCPSLAPDSILRASQQPPRPALVRPSPVQASSVRWPFSVYNYLGVEGYSTFSDIQKEITDPENEFISLMPPNIIPWERPTRCLAKR